MKSADIRGLWKKKKIQKKILWQILQLLILPLSVCQVSQKRQCYWSRPTNCFFLLTLVFWNLCQWSWYFELPRNSLQLVFYGHDKLVFCLAVAHTSIFNPQHQAFLLESQCMKPFFSFLLQSFYLKQIFLQLSVWFFLHQLSFFIHLLI